MALGLGSLPLVPYLSLTVAGEGHDDVALVDGGLVIAREVEVALQVHHVPLVQQAARLLQGLVHVQQELRRGRGEVVVQAGAPCMRVRSVRTGTGPKRVGTYTPITYRLISRPRLSKPRVTV